LLEEFLLIVPRSHPDNPDVQEGYEHSEDSEPKADQPVEDKEQASSEMRLEQGLPEQQHEHGRGQEQKAKPPQAQVGTVGHAE
jgi:hypothetical protein